MANIMWSGIEQSKYGLSANWYVSAYYGNDNDIDGVGLYNSSTNPTGHGGPTRPFATLEKIHIEGKYSDVVVFDSGYYYSVVNFTSKSFKYVADGNVNFELNQATQANYFYGIKLINSNIGSITGFVELFDCQFYYSNIYWRRPTISGCVFVECYFKDNSPRFANISNCTIVSCSGVFGVSNYLSSVSPILKNIMIINCPNLTLNLDDERLVGSFFDYSILVGTIKTTHQINGKTLGVTIEDFKTDGKYFIKSYSEVDIWGNTSGSGASLLQLQEIFCNYISPLYIDTWAEANFHLKPNTPDILKYGGLNGSFIGAKPIMHWFNSESLWDTYRDIANTTNLEKDSISKAIVISGAAESGTYRSTRISLPKPITASIAKFAANLVYSIEGTVKQGVSNQRIDTTPDLLPDNTANQRVVYDFKLATAQNNTDSLTAFKNYELNRELTIDNQGRSHLNNAFDSTKEAKQKIQDFVIEFTLRKVVIE